jgi:dTDP-4-amino-4,6-dideoxygalactose transaminase
MRVPMLDLGAQYETLREDLLAAVTEVMDGHRYINGPQVAELERAIAEYSDCPGAVGVSSGTDALLCALMTLGIGAGDEVITTPYTFFATAGSIWRSGARPVFVDIDPVTFNIDPARIEAAITARTRAVMPVHLFGQMADMEAICDIADRRNLRVIEDAAQAIGATQRGRKAGSFGDVGCFSFFPSKNLGGLGDGGMVTARDAALLERLLQCRNHGSNPKYFHAWVGGNFRLDTLQATALMVKLHHLEHWTVARRRNAALYDTLLAEVAEVTTPVVRPENGTVFNQYVIRARRRDDLQRRLTERGIASAIYYPLSLHQQECFAPLGYVEGQFPHSERAAAGSLALPVYPELTGEQIRYVVAEVKGFYDG